MGAGAEKMIWAILILGLILRLISLNQSLWLDEGINVLASKNFSLYGLITQYAIADFHPPGWFIILWIWGKIFGFSEIAVRAPSVIFGILTIFITFLIGKKLFSKNLGLIAAFLLSINPLHIYYSQEARMYSLASLAVAINVYIFIKLVKKEKINLTFLVISNLGVLLSDYLAYFIFPTLLIFLLIFKQKDILKKWIISLIVSLILWSIWLPIFLKQLNTGAVASSNLPTWKFVVGGFDFKTIPLTFIKFIIGRISLADKVLYTAILLPISSLFVYLLWRGIKTSDNLSRKLLISWIAIPPIIATIISLFIPVYNYFRVLFIIPSFVILIAGGILSIRNKLRSVLLVSVISIEIFCTLTYLLSPAFQREDWKGLVNFLKNQKEFIVLFESSGTLPPFDYYAEKSINAKGALKDFPAKDENSVANLAGLLKEQRKVYLVDYLVQISDPNRLVAKELTKLGYKQTDIKNFNGVGFVYEYQK